MSRIILSNTGDWKLKFDEQDVRGYRAVDKDGAPVGTVDGMVLDTEQKRVSSILLEDGTEYPASDISIGEGVVYLTSVDTDTATDADGSVTVYDDYGHVVEREAVGDADFDAHAAAFRTHATSAYGADSNYDDYSDAYRYGFESAHDDTYRNQSYVDAEDDLRGGYGSAYADRDYDTDRAAVRYGYTRAQHGDR